MKLRRTFLILASLLAAMLLAACGSSGSSGTSTTSGSSGTSSTGRMSVTLTDGPINGYSNVWINIQSVEINSGGGWIALGSPSQTYDLLTLTGGLGQTLANGVTLPTGHYGQMRLILGSTGNSVVLADDSSHPLTVPSGAQTGIKLIVSFDVAAGTTSDVWIDFDAAHSIQLVSAGASNAYILRPTLRAFDKTVTGSVSGTFTDRVSQSALAGAMVYAETLDSLGNPSIARSTVTDSTGAYSLTLLPLEGTYYVVSQPKVGTTSYDAQSSGALALTSTSPTQTFTSAFTADASVGTVTGTVTATATPTQSDTVNLMQALDSSNQNFVVDSTVAVVSSAESYSFLNVPWGNYSVQDVRTTQHGNGATITVDSTGLFAGSLGSGSNPLTLNITGM